MEKIKGQEKVQEVNREVVQEINQEKKEKIEDEKFNIFIFKYHKFLYKKS